MSDPTPSDPTPAEAASEAAAAPPAAKPGPTATVKPAAKAEAKPARPPAPEDAPFASFVPDALLPALAREIRSYGGPEPQLRFEQGSMPVVGGPCWMVAGELPGERRFWLCFTAEDIGSAKTVALAESGSEPTLLEPFLSDEKKMSQALLVSRLVQRLNGQKWLGPN
ncbi:DUF2996 domain-containing protein [Cyanobium sp. CH-040]|uniref:DUF2996 domain-containing protein n=1 Tax=Cyanobium sp. CH-040 TaxID=2823708 RepID=UPI0020CD5BED|nr:DUF2996 domain-containing protein [Cyanobium sp. CH-040]